MNLRLVSIVHYFELRRHMNRGFSSYFVVFYDRLLYFWGINALLRDGSVLLAPFFITIGYLSKDVRRLKDLFSSLFSTTKAHEYCFFVVLHFNL